MRRDVLIELRARDEDVRQRLEHARAHLRALRVRANRTEAPDVPYRSDQAGVGKEELAAAVAEEDKLLSERERVRRGLADAGIHTSLPSAPTHTATACPARWGEMDGDERTRVCARCQKRVHDVDGLSTEEIDALVSRVQPATTLFRRADGTLIAGDCPVGKRRTRNALAIVGVSGVVVLGALAFALDHGQPTASPQPPLPKKPKVPDAAIVDTPRPRPTLVVDESKLTPDEKAYVEAAFVHPNREKRLVAARPLVTKGSWSMFLSNDREDYAALRNEIDPSKKAQVETTILEGAILSGDRELLAAVARDATTTKEDKSWVTYETRVGAIRCLLGDKAGGMAALRVADKLARANHQPFEPQDHVRPAHASERADAHVAAIACGSPLEPPESDVALENEEEVLSALGLPSSSKYHRGDSFDALLRAAPQIAVTGKLDPKMRIYVGGWLFLAPRSVFVRGNAARAPTVALGVVERAAAKVEPSSKDAASYLWLAAAEEHARRGDLDGARTDARRAEADMPANALPLSVPLRLAIGDVHDAQALIAKARASSDNDRLELVLWRAQAHLAASEWAEALADARTLDAESRTSSMERSGNARQWTTLAGWLRAALGWRTCARESGPNWSTTPNLDVWEDAPWTSPEARRTLRVSEGQHHMSTPLPTELSAPVRGAILYLMGEVAAGEGDVDVWLDAVERLMLPARAYFIDRAAAAHLRGDEAAVKKWHERASHWSALIHDDATAVLASVAGL